MRHFKVGLQYYYHRVEFSRAIKQFREALALNPGDTLCATYIKRWETLMVKPPEPAETASAS